MIEIRPAKQEDVDAIRQNPIEESLKNYPPLTLQDDAWSGWVHGKLVGVGGVMVYWEGVGEAWIILSKDVLNFPIEALRCLARMMEYGINKHNLKRIQATARRDFSKGQQMLEHLGFVQEGLMRKYLPDGSDAYLYARIIDG